MMKILLLCEDIHGKYGWATYAKDLDQSLIQNNHKTIIVSHINSKNDSLNILPKPLLMLSRPWKGGFLARKIKKIYNKHNPDVIHITVEPYAMIVPFLGKKLREKVVLTIHGSYGVIPLNTWLTRIIAKKYYTQIPHFITVSNYTKNRVIEELRNIMETNLADQFSKKTHVIHNGIQMPKKTDPIAHNGNSIIHVGGVKSRKGALEAIKACAYYKQMTQVPFTLTFIGSIPENSYVKNARNLTKELGIKENVAFKGTVSDAELQKIYRSADLLLLPANTLRDTFEGFGLVYIEANAYGVPCIGPDDSGAKEAILEGKSGYHARSDNPEMIAERIEWILDRKNIDRNECKKWAQEHDINSCIKSMEEVYKLVQSNQ